MTDLPELTNVAHQTRLWTHAEAVVQFGVELTTEEVSRFGTSLTIIHGGLDWDFIRQQKRIEHDMGFVAEHKAALDGMTKYVRFVTDSAVLDEMLAEVDTTLERKRAAINERLLQNGRTILSINYYETGQADRALVEDRRKGKVPNDEPAPYHYKAHEFLGRRVGELVECIGFNPNDSNFIYRVVGKNGQNFAFDPHQYGSRHQVIVDPAKLWNEPAKSS